MKLLDNVMYFVSMYKLYRHTLEYPRLVAWRKAKVALKDKKRYS